MICLAILYEGATYRHFLLGYLANLASSLIAKKLLPERLPHAATLNRSVAADISCWILLNFIV
jgi:hypothetical protein